MTTLQVLLVLLEVADLKEIQNVALLSVNNGALPVACTNSAVL